MVRYCTLEEEVQPERAKRGVMRQALAAEDTAVNASLYILLRAVDRFQATCGRFPGTAEGCAHAYLPLLTFKNPVGAAVLAGLVAPREMFIAICLSDALDAI